MASETSIDSESSTIPLTPENDSVNALRLDPNEVFAWLRPFNEPAEKAFDAVINTVIKHSPDCDHFRPFLHCDSRGSRSQSEYSDNVSFSDDQSSYTPYRWAGAFGLRLTHLPHDPVQGWCMGNGRDRSSSRAIDLLLVPPKKHLKEMRIHSHHATMKLHTQSCQVGLLARHTVKVSRNGAKTFRESESFLFEPGEIVSLGQCAYTFEYTEYFHSPAFKDAITKYMRKYHEHQWSMNPHISPSSVRYPTILGDYYCSPTAFDQGTFGRINAGWNKSGGTVAIKTFKNPIESEIRAHEELMRSIGKHENILELLTCVYDFKVKIPNAYCIYSPLAVADLSDVIRRYTTDINAKLALFTDYLNGLSYLHDQKGIMHRDISPGNLAVTSLHEPRGIIIDLDAAITDSTSADHMKGTMPYLAPEILALKYGTKVKTQLLPFDKSVDTWALGLTMYALFTDQLFSWISFGATPSKGGAIVTQEAHRNLRSRIQESAQGSESPETRAALGLVLRLIEWEAFRRHTASTALGRIRKVWRSDTRGTIVARRGQKRSTPHSN